jgi:rhodanese-related sulfurtransferase
MAFNPNRNPIGTLLLMLLLATALPTGCATGRTPDMSGPELLSRIKAEDPPTIVDSRSADEYESGHIPGAIHIPFWSVFSRHDQISSPPEAPLLIYCEHGPRATMAKLAFRMVGYEDIAYLEGDLEAWKAANLPLEKTPAPK